MRLKANNISPIICLFFLQKIKMPISTPLWPNVVWASLPHEESLTPPGHSVGIWFGEEKEEKERVTSMVIRVFFGEGCDAQTQKVYGERTSRQEKGHWCQNIIKGIWPWNWSIHALNVPGDLPQRIHRWVLFVMSMTWRHQQAVMGLLPAEPFLLQTLSAKVAPKQFDHEERNANLTHLPLIS